MAAKRKKTARMRTAEQVRVLASAGSFEIIEALQAGGAATVAELGPRLGRKANSLHYHIRKLTHLGLVRQVGSRRSGARTEAVYDVTADSLEGPTVAREPVLRQATVDAVASILRLATRNFARAVEHRKGLTKEGRHRNILAHRSKAWLTRTDLAEVNRHIAAMERIFTRNSGTQRGSLCALTVVLTPIEGKPE